VQLDGLGHGEPPPGGGPGPDQVPERPGPDLLTVRRVGPGELGGLLVGGRAEVVGEQLRELVAAGAGQLLQPGADLGVGGGPLQLGMDR
jgi:hypothetical protein